MDELHDFLAFEIDKAGLALDKDQWSSQAAPDETTATQRWYDLLLALKNQYATDQVMYSLTFLESLSDRLEEVFDDCDDENDPEEAED